MRTSPHRAPKLPDSSNTPPPPWSFPCLPPNSPQPPRVPPSSEPPAGSESKKGVRRSPLPPRAPQPRRPSPPGLSSDLSAQAEGSARRPDAHLTPGRLAFHATSRPGKHLPPTMLALPGSRTPLPAASPLMPDDLLPRRLLTPGIIANAPGASSQASCLLRFTQPAA
jgi:hypothetical protein